jgi:hypothetical protein
MKDRVIFSIPVRAESLNSSVRPNTKIGLLFSKNEEPFDQSVVIPDVILLGIEKRENSSTLVTAIGEAQLSTIKGILAKSDIFVIQN